MTYVEWLRVRNTLRVTAIILLILVGLAVVLRVSLARYMTPEGWVSHIQNHPGVTIANSTLPDGAKRTTIVDPSDGTTAVIDDHGYAGKHIVVTEPSGRAHKERDHVDVGSMHVYTSQNGALTTTVIDTNGAVPMIYYMALADVVALIIATLMAAPFAREINGHLEVTLTRPCSRLRYALGVLVADATCVLAASLMTILALYFCQLLFESPRLDFSGINARAIAMGVAAPLAWYAMLCAATTWLNRSFGAVQGFAWPVTFLIGGLTLVPPTNAVALFVHDVAWTISRIIPLSYVQMSVGDQPNSLDQIGTNFAARLGTEVLLFVVYAAIAVWQWQRVEA